MIEKTASTPLEALLATTLLITLCLIVVLASTGNKNHGIILTEEIEEGAVLGLEWDNKPDCLDMVAINSASSRKGI